jgi:hypothetical protein
VSLSIRTVSLLKRTLHLVNWKTKSPNSRQRLFFKHSSNLGQREYFLMPTLA